MRQKKILCNNNRAKSDAWRSIQNYWYIGSQTSLFIGYRNRLISQLEQWFPTWGLGPLGGARDHTGAHNSVCSEVVRLPKLYLCNPLRLIDKLVHQNHVTNSRWCSSEMEPLWVSVLTCVLEQPSNYIPVFKSCWQANQITGLMVNNVGHVFSQTLPSRLLRVCCRKRQ